jgi:hypothetical protein
LRNGGTGLAGGEIVYMPGCSSTNCLESDFSNASAAAARAVVAVVVLGLEQICPHYDAKKHEMSNHCRGYMSDQSSFEQEGHDRTSIALAGHQYDLALAVSKARPKATVCILVIGGSIALKSLLTDCDAILSVWYPGQQGGAALADILFGKVSLGLSRIVALYHHSATSYQICEHIWHPSISETTMRPNPR